MAFQRKLARGELWEERLVLHARVAADLTVPSGKSS